jgi:hypothetical protein
MALLRLQTRRIASPCNIRNRTSDLSFSRTPKRNHPYRASGLVRRPEGVRCERLLRGDPLSSSVDQLSAEAHIEGTVQRTKTFRL